MFSRGYTFRKVILLALAGATSFSLLFATGASARYMNSTSAKPTVVLVHGAFADASSWNAAVKDLEDDGFPVVAPANPLRGIPTDASYISAFLRTVTGPIVLVGHSYGGAVITNAATGNSNVRALVYIAAYIPDAGQTIGQLVLPNSGSELVGNAVLLQPCPMPFCPAGAEAYVNPANFHDAFAADLSSQQAAILAAEQRPLSVSAFADQTGTPAWKTTPSFALVPNQDHAIGTKNELRMAQHANAQIVRVDGSHLVMISQPDAVVGLIETAAGSGNY
jgi:pimeloyl-ACP methyl ester carboxylesterase